MRNTGRTSQPRTLADWCDTTKHPFAGFVPIAYWFIDSRWFKMRKPAHRAVILELFSRLNTDPKKDRDPKYGPLSVGQVYISIGTLAEAAKVTEDQARQVVEQMAKAKIITKVRANVPRLGFSQQPTLITLIDPKAYFESPEWRPGRVDSFARQNFNDAHGRFRVWPRGFQLTDTWRSMTATQRAVAFALYMSIRKNDHADPATGTLLKRGQDIATFKEVAVSAKLKDAAEARQATLDMVSMGLISTRDVTPDDFVITWHQFDAFEAMGGSNQLSTRSPEYSSKTRL